MGFLSNGLEIPPPFVQSWPSKGPRWGCLPAPRGEASQCRSLLWGLQNCFAALPSQPCLQTDGREERKKKPAIYLFFSGSARHLGRQSNRIIFGRRPLPHHSATPAAEARGLSPQPVAFSTMGPDKSRDGRPVSSPARFSVVAPAADTVHSSVVPCRALPEHEIFMVDE